MANEVSSSSSFSTPSTSHFIFTVIQPARPCLAWQGNSEEWERRHLPFRYSAWVVNLGWQSTAGVHLDVSGMSLSTSNSSPFSDLWETALQWTEHRQNFGFSTLTHTTCLPWFSQHTQEKSLCCTNLYISALLPSMSSLLRPGAGRVLPLDNGFPCTVGTMATMRVQCCCALETMGSSYLYPTLASSLSTSWQCCCPRRSSIALLCPISWCLPTLLWIQF